MTLAVALLAAQALAGEPFIGLAQPSGGGVFCVAMPGPPLDAGSAVTLVRVDAPQRAMVALVERETVACDRLERAMIAGPYYLARRSADARVDADGSIWVALAGVRATRQQGEAATVALSTAYPNARLRSCSSSEGLHLTAWAGQPLRSRRLWHEYYYLGYDVEPSCEPADYKQ